MAAFLPVKTGTVGGSGQLRAENITPYRAHGVVMNIGYKVRIRHTHVNTSGFPPFMLSASHLCSWKHSHLLRVKLLKI